LQPNALPTNVIYPSVTSVYSIAAILNDSTNDFVSGVIEIWGESITKVGITFFFFIKENIVSPP
jgi:hypothetical protein